MTRHRMRRVDVDALVEHSIEAARSPGREICGLLVDTGYFIKPIQLDNKRPAGGYEFYVRQVRKIKVIAEALGCEIVGTFHSHPAYTARPGDSDIAGAPNDSLMLIIDVCDRDYALWRVYNGRASRIRLTLLVS